MSLRDRTPPPTSLPFVCTATQTTMGTPVDAAIRTVSRAARGPPLEVVVGAEPGNVSRVGLGRGPVGLPGAISSRYAAGLGRDVLGAQARDRPKPERPSTKARAVCCPAGARGYCRRASSSARPRTLRRSPAEASDRSGSSGWRSLALAFAQDASGEDRTLDPHRLRLRVSCVAPRAVLGVVACRCGLAVRVEPTSCSWCSGASCLLRAGQNVAR